jgi:hypothetical protein
VPGIGEKKAVALLVWRQTILAELKKRQPTALAASERERIESRYGVALRNLNSEETTVKQDAQRQKEAARNKYSLERARRAARIREIREKADRAKFGTDASLRTAQYELRTAVFKVGNIERRLRAYAGISAMGYVRFVLGMRR